LKSNLKPRLYTIFTGVVGRGVEEIAV